MSKLKWKSFGAAMLIVALTVLAYLPALRGGFIWDDDDYVTDNLGLRDAAGLKRIWTDTNATRQYYPLVHTSFWLEYHIWGLNPFGFHAVNVLLHSFAAILLWRVLVRLSLPGAWLAAAIFALHPVCVESVAWITERKNVLSAVFYFAAAAAYLRFAGVDGPEKPKWRLYCAALFLFVAALLSKTVTCSLPAALLLVFWWKRGRIALREILPLLPFFAIGVVLALHTSWLEKNHVGARGAEWAFSFWDRCLIAGRALWFYAGKLVWPTNLAFIYPRWTINASTGWQWFFPGAFIWLVAGLWLLRNRIGRGPLTAVLFFAGTLFPALGFFNVYPMRFSFVADHFQYLACVGLIALATAVLTKLAARASLLLPFALAILTWQQAHSYRDLETLWRDTLAKNPACWLAHAHWAKVLKQNGRFAEAEEHYRAALKIKPDEPDALNDLGVLLNVNGRTSEAMDYFHRALGIDPHDPVTWNNLGAVLAGERRFDEAMECYRRSLQIDSSIPETHINLGGVLMQLGREAEGLNEYREALRCDTASVSARTQLGAALAAAGRLNEAETEFRETLRRAPDSADAHFNLGNVLALGRRMEEAVVEYEAALRLRPDHAQAHLSAGVALVDLGRREEGTRHLREALRLNPADDLIRKRLETLAAPANQ